jgi:hypothetical protein
MAARQFGSWSAACTDFGIGETDDVVTALAYRGFGLNVPNRERVVIGCTLGAPCTSGGVECCSAVEAGECVPGDRDGVGEDNGVAALTEPGGLDGAVRAGKSGDVGEAGAVGGVDGVVAAGWWDDVIAEGADHAGRWADRGRGEARGEGGAHSHAATCVHGLYAGAEVGAVVVVDRNGKMPSSSK